MVLGSGELRFETDVEVFMKSEVYYLNGGFPHPP